VKNLFMAVVLAVSCVIGISQAHAEDVVVKNGSKVAFDYSLSVDGKVIDQSAGKAPLEYTHGEGKLLPGLAKGIEGMKVGEEKTIELKPEDAYGQSNPLAFQEVPASSLPAELKPQVGMILEANDKNGQAFPVRVAEIKGDKIVMDFNHPLAGKTLTFKVKVASIK